MGIFDSVTSLLGGAQKYGADADLSAGRGYLDAQGGIARKYGGLGDAAMTQYGADSGTYRSALTGYENYLKADPNTDNYSTAQIARSTEGTTQAYTRARANLAASAAMSGQGGGPSSLMAGGEQGINTAAAGSLASAQNAYSRDAIARHGQNLATLANLTGGVANTDYGRGLSAYGQEEGIDSRLSGAYLGLGQNERQMEQQSQQQADSSLYGLAGAAGGYFGLGSVQPGAQSSAVTGGGVGADPDYSLLDYSGYSPSYPQITTPEYYGKR